MLDKSASIALLGRIDQCVTALQEQTARKAILIEA
jgi:hypothetical protein